MDFSSSLNTAFKRLAHQFPNDFPPRIWAAQTWEKILGVKGYVEVRINGDEYRLLPKYRNFRSNFEPAGIALVKKLLKDCDGFIDAGANLGFYSIVARKILQKSAPLYAIEANPFTMEILKKHHALNASLENVEFLCRAAWDTSDTSLRIVASLEKAGDTCARLAPKGVEVQTIRLDALEGVDRCRSLLIKVDVEGAEFHLLKGAEGLLRSPTPPLFFISIHPMYLPEFGASEIELYQYLKNFGYRFFDVKLNEVSTLGYDAYLAVPEGRVY